MSLTKSWKNNARFAIFAGDYPCHGNKYHKNDLTDYFPNGISYRKNIEESVKELAEKNISLFCMKLTEHTDIMFEIFKNIYKNYNNIKYEVVPLESEKNLSNIIASSSIDIYIKQRDIK